MRFQFSTDDVPERDHFTFWADGVRANAAARREPLPDATGPFRASMFMQSSGPLAYFKVEADPHVILRGSREVARMQEETYWIYREASAATWCNYAGQETISHAGDLIIADFGIPFEARAKSGFKYESWLVPKALIEPHLPRAARAPMLRTLRHDGVGGLAASYLETLTRNWDDIPEAAMGQVADTLARLLGIAGGAVAEEHSAAVGAARLEEAKRYIDCHLALPELTPGAVAAALRISVRTLHLLFEPSGNTFARHVLRRRLEETRSTLLCQPERPVIDIAFAWGFNSLSSFYRAFQAAFGMSPGDLRASARTARRP